MSSAIYILDTSCLTQAHRIYYPFDIAPSFWDFLKKHVASGDFVVINKVADEIARGRDILATWVNSNIPVSEQLDCNTEAGILNHYASIMTWGSSHPQFSTLAKKEFADFENADPFIVAAALEKSATVVSQEISATSSKKNIKLPDVCSQFRINHIDTFTLLRIYGFTM
jgi:hypothetical protein